MKAVLVKADYATARADIIDGLLAFRIWTRLGWQEVKRRYRRTVFGPFWATLSIGMFIGGMVFIWAPLFHADVRSYLPFLSAGLVAWTFATALITEGCGTYTAGVSLITQLNFPYTVLNFMVVWRNIIVFFHNVVIVVIVVIALQVPVSWKTLLLFPGIAIVAVNGAWMTVLFGMLSARFRDIPPFVGNLMQNFDVHNAGILVCQSTGRQLTGSRQIQFHVSPDRSDASANARHCSIADQLCGHARVGSDRVAGDFRHLCTLSAPHSLLALTGPPGVTSIIAENVTIDFPIYGGSGAAFARPCSPAPAD